MSSFVVSRRVIALASALCMSASLVACGPSADKSGAAETGSSDKPVVLTTFTVLADMTREVGGDYVDVQSITKPGAEIHDYEPTPSDIKRAADADLILDNGLGLERWFEKFVSGLKVPHHVLTEGVTPIDITEDAYAGLPNPHAWMSPDNGLIYVDNIVSALSELDPDHAEQYAANGKAYKDKISAIKTSMTSELEALPSNERALVSCEGAFSYLARDTGLTERYIWAVNAENQATPQQIADTIEFVKENQVPAVFCESTVSDKPMQQVVDATDARFGGVLYVDSLSEADGPVPTYLDLLEHDAATITSGLTGSAK